MFELVDFEGTLPQERQKFRRALKHGTGFENGKERVRKYAAEMNKKDFAEAVKKEYGIGGSSFEDGWIGTTSTYFYICDDGWNSRHEYSWTEVANEILDMIKNNIY